MRRRDVLRLLGGALGLAAAPRLALARARPDDFFVFIHAAGGWDVTVWADPRNERRGLVEPAAASNTDARGLAHWRGAPGGSFEIVDDGRLRLGPAIGDLYDLRDRLTIINGIAMNTVSHEDGTTYATTGRHRTGGTVAESSIDVVVANELGTSQLMPNVSIKFPSAFVGDRLDRRAIPLRVSAVDAITKSFERSAHYLDVHDRDAISGALAEEAGVLATDARAPAVYERLASQHQAMPLLLDETFLDAFDPKWLRQAYPQFAYKGRFHGAKAVVAAFALEAMQRDLVRCVSFSLGGLDTHHGNYRHHAHTLQELFGVIATFVKQLDVLPHPTRPREKLAERTHVLVVSEFCRTPQLNPANGRDHYPNNSALVISPRFRRGVFGATDAEQLLPLDAPLFRGGKRPITPPDVLATFMRAFGIDPRRYMRDGEPMEALLA